MDWLRHIHGTANPPPTFRTGDEIRVWYRILEQGKERFGQFEGTVIRYRGAGASKTFTVRRVTYGEGVERTFPADSTAVSKIEVLRQGKVKRARLYFLRRVIGKTRIAAAHSEGGAEMSANPASLAQQPAERTPEQSQHIASPAASGLS